MPQEKIIGPARKGKSPDTESGQVSRRDLVEIILEPLANQIDRARLEVVDKLQGLNDSIEIVARQMRREFGSDRD